MTAQTTVQDVNALVMSSADNTKTRAVLDLVTEIIGLGQRIEAGAASPLERMAFADLGRQLDNLRLSPTVWRLLREHEAGEQAIIAAERLLALHNADGPPQPPLPLNLAVSRWRSTPPVAPWFGETDSSAEGGARSDLPPRFRALFAGPARSGKSTCARAIARHRGLPVVEFGPSQMQAAYGSYVRQFVDRAARIDALLLIEAADLLLTRSDMVGDVAASQRAALLAEEIVRYDGAVIAVTRRPELLDDAVRARFDIRVEFAALAPHLSLV